MRFSRTMTCGLARKPVTDPPSGVACLVGVGGVARNLNLDPGWMRESAPSQTPLAANRTTSNVGLLNLYK